MRGFLTRLSRSRFPYEPLVTVYISRERLIHNLHEFMKIAPGGMIAPVLKSNAYGHGLIEVARILETEARQLRTEQGKIPFLIVDSYFEAVTLRAARIRMPLLIIGYTRPETIARSRLRDVSFTVTSLETLKHIAHFQSSFMNFPSRMISIHLKFDTGMHRQGILPEEIDHLADIIDANPSLLLRGICSHLSDADNADDSSFTESQIHRWNSIADRLSTEYTSLKYAHVSNTDGHRFVSESHANVSRLGLGLYGLIDGRVFTTSLDLKPVMRMETIVTDVKKLKRDEVVGYSNTFKADRDMTIATIPVGYYEGVDRRLSNIGSILISREHAPCPILGRISMNITVIDVSHIPPVKIGMPVTVISDDARDENSIISIAKKCSTIPYEIAIHVPGQLKRVID